MRSSPGTSSGQSTTGPAGAQAVARRRLRARVVVGFTSVVVVGASSLVGVGPLAANALATNALAAEACGASPVPTFFTDEVQQPPVAAPDRTDHYTLTAHRGTHKFSSLRPAVPSLGYSTANAKVDYLGPTIITRKDRPIDVTIVNALPKAGKPIFPFDQPNDSNAIVLHRHGGLQTADSDGAPGQEIPPGHSRTNHYPNNQAAAPLWYHDHAQHLTSFNVYEGLAGFMPNTDALEPLFNLPAAAFAKAYVLQDKSFNEDYTLCYSHADPEFFGDLPVVNGTIAPKQTVQPRRCTFTFINGSDSRSYSLALKQVSGTASPAPKMTVVGNDSGYLLRPARIPQARLDRLVRQP
jgi:spore coat protein A